MPPCRPLPAPLRKPFARANASTLNSCRSSCLRKNKTLHEAGSYFWCGRQELRLWRRAPAHSPRGWCGLRPCRPSPAPLRKPFARANASTLNSCRSSCLRKNKTLHEAGSYFWCGRQELRLWRRAPAHSPRGWCGLRPCRPSPAPLRKPFARANASTLNSCRSSCLRKNKTLHKAGSYFWCPA